MKGKRSPHGWIVGLVAAGFSLSAGVQAQTDLLGETWRWVQFTAEYGLPANEVYSVVESARGMVWAATNKGVAWYDGFRWHAVGEDAGLPSQRPASLAVDGRGRVLVVVEKRLFQGDEKGFQRIPETGPGAGWDIRSAVPFGEDGILLLSGSFLYLYQHGDLQPFAPPEVSVGLNPSLFRRRAGTIWFGADPGVFRWQEGAWVPAPSVAQFLHLVEDRAGNVVLAGIDPTGKRGLWEGVAGETLRHNPLEGEDLVVSLDMGPDGEVLVAYDSGAIRVRRNGVWSSLYPVPPQLQNALCVRFRENGDLWVGTEDGLFLYRTSSQRWTYWRHAEQDTRNRLHEILRTREGDVWLATVGGVEIRRPDGSSEWINQVQGNRLEGVTGLMEDEEGGVWISSGSSFAGAYRWDGRAWRHFGADQGLSASRVHKIRKDRRGRLWFLGMAGMGEEKEPGAFVYADGRFARWGTEEGLIHGRVYAFAEGEAGELWFGTLGGLSRWREGFWTHWTRREGLREERIFALAVDGHGQLWFADQKNGLGFIDAQDRPQYLTTADGLVHDEVWDLQVDTRGRLWVATQGGLCNRRDGGWLAFRTRHGLSNNRLWPILPTEDRVYVGTRANGLCVLSLEGERLPPPQVVFAAPAVEEGSARLRWQAFSWWGQSPTDELETRHRLGQGEWSGWSRQREIELSGLSSGTHTFQVQARGLFGNFDPAGQELSFEIPLPLHRHPGVVVPIGLLLIAVIGLSSVMVIRRRRLAAERHFLLTRARCLLWQARVEERNGTFAWDIEVADEAAAQTFLPLKRFPGQSYTDAWYQSKLPEDRQRMDETSGAALLANEPGYSQEFRCKQADGQVRWLSEDVRIVPLGPRRWQLAGVCIDITGRKQAELQQRQVQRLELIDQLARGVAHEINNPLTLVIGYTRLLWLTDKTPIVLVYAPRNRNILYNLQSIDRNIQATPEKCQSISPAAAKERAGSRTAGEPRGDPRRRATGRGHRRTAAAVLAVAE